MADEKEKTVKLLTVKESSNDAEAIYSMMRNAGHAIRSKNVEDEEDLLEALDQQPWDLILSSLVVGDFTAQQVLEIVGKSGKDIPVIVLAESTDEDAKYNLLEAGATDVVSTSNSKLLLILIDRTLKSLNNRRKLRDTELQYNESEKRNRTLMDSSRDAIAYIHEGMHIYSNTTYLESFGITDAEEIEGITIMDLIGSEDQQRFKTILQKLSKGENPDEEFEFTAVPEEGEKFKAIMEFTPASIDGEHCTQIIIRTQGDNKELQKELDALRKQDLLTGLYNRQFFMEQLDNAVNVVTKKGVKCCILYIEIDDFKAITENIGIAASDLILTDFANILRNHMSKNDLAAHFAGSLFTCLMPNKAAADVTNIAEKIRAETENHIFDVEGQSVTGSVSIGVNQISETNANSKKALGQAEMACKKVRGSEGNGVHVHSAEDEKAYFERDQKWVDLVKHALEKNEFKLAFQPIVSLHAEPGERYEVLLRMVGEGGKEIMPGEFLGSAEQAGLMSEIDRWVTKQAVKIIASKRNTDVQTMFFIKLSHDSIKDQTLLVWISKLLKAARIHGDALCFEISESLAVNALKETKAFANGLKQLHCNLAIDHVGSEAKSFTYLKHLEAQFLKIDGSHIQELPTNEQSQEIVKTIADMAKANKSKVIAEHVQDPNSLAALWQYGINFIQGYYLQQPEHEMNYDFTAED